MNSKGVNRRAVQSRRLALTSLPSPWSRRRLTVRFSIRRVGTTTRHAAGRLFDLERSPSRLQQLCPMEGVTRAEKN
jgi:hypothetical protein